MQLLILSFVGIAIIVTAMAVGVLMGRKPISGSCGGMAAIGMDGECDICGGDPARCEEEGAEKDALQTRSSARSEATAFYEVRHGAAKR